jgi:CRISPR-associated protein Csm3
MQLRLIGRARLNSTMRVLTGLHIGAGRDTIEIGGIDNPVIKHPFFGEYNGEPYVPGSSIKGKLRFLLEWAFGKIQDNGLAWGSGQGAAPLDPSDPVLRIFGTPASGKEWIGGPTRLLVRDARLDRTWADLALKSGGYTEEKTEVVIDRIAGKAHDIGPRRTERVPAGSGFEVKVVFRLFDWDGDGGRRDHDCLNWLLQGFDLLEQDALGGSGSRGYGRVQFENLTLIAPDGAKHGLDNRFRGHAFDTRRPADIVPPLGELIPEIRA